jgi:hypothetical protein
VINADVVIEPEVGDKLVIAGDGSTAKAMPLLLMPETETTMFPVVAPDGTVTAMLDAVQFVTVAVAPLNETVLVP